MKIHISFPGFEQIQRTCATSDTCSEASYGLFGMGFWTTCCTTDGCNSANTFKVNYQSVLGISLFSITLKRYFV